MLIKEALLTLISEEKEFFGKYSQQCAVYQIQPDPLAVARHQGKLEILQRLIQMDKSGTFTITTKT